MPVPDFQTIMLPLLKIFSDRQEHSIPDTTENLTHIFNLTDEELNEVLPSGKQTRFQNRIGWARTYLAKTKLIEATRRAHYQITERGLQILHASPAFFERLVVELLVNMGYGGSRKDAARAVGQSGDEGIDGIIDEDRLGLDTIYIQAKRWKLDQGVGRPEIQKFVGALAGKRAKKGIFITTSKFSGDALKYVNEIDAKVILIDGKRLAEFMIDYNVGVAEVTTYQIKKIDSDYFENA